MVCCIFQPTNLVSNYEQRKSSRTFVSRQEASNKLYVVVKRFFIPFKIDSQFSNLNSHLATSFIYKKIDFVSFNFYYKAIGTSLRDGILNVNSRSL